MDTKFIKLQSRMYMYNKKNIKMFCFFFLFSSPTIYN